MQRIKDSRYWLRPQFSHPFSDARAEDQGRPKTSYPSLGNVPPTANKSTMAIEEQLKLKKELSAARDRQAIKGSRAGTPPAKPYGLRLAANNLVALRY